MISEWLLFVNIESMLFMYRCRHSKEFYRLISLSINPSIMFQYCVIVNDEEEIWKALARSKHVDARFWKCQYIKYVKRRPIIVWSLLFSRRIKWIQVLRKTSQEFPHFLKKLLQKLKLCGSG